MGLSGETETAPRPAADAKQAPTPVEVAQAEAEAAPKPTLAKPPENVDLHVPRAWMIAGGSVLAASLLGSLLAEVVMDDPDLALTIAGAGGTLGIAGLTVGVVLRNHRYEEVGYKPAPALPSGLTLKLGTTFR